VDNRSNCFGIIVGGQADEDVDLADIDELAKEIVCEEAFFCQFPLRSKHLRVST
jgi:hypothetical protein